MNYRNICIVGLSVLLTACSAPKPISVHGKYESVNYYKPLSEQEKQTEILFMMNQKLDSILNMPVQSKEKNISSKINLYYPYNVASFKHSSDLDRLVNKAKSSKRINIVARTDGNKPTVRDRHIAMSRATNVRNYLVNNGINPTVIFVNYAAATDYADNNFTDVGRANNRRVEIELIEKKQ